MFYDGKWVLQQVDNNHDCEPSRARVIAEKLRHEMKEIVRADPVQPVGRAVRKVRVAAAEKYGDDEEFFMHLIAELGCDTALEKQLLRVRQEIYGPTPRSRNGFEPKMFLNQIYGEKDNVVVMDSNDMPEGWKDKIEKVNPNSEYAWDRVSAELRDIENEYHIDDDDDEEEEVVNTQETENVETDLPKRVLAFSSQKLLRQLSRNLKSSVDGTFKSSSKLWRQQFIWMIKDNGYWVPVVFGWLPDKTETSYKVFFSLVEEKLKELGLGLKVKSVLCDFEINIMKSIDVMLQCPILGCFFHHKKCFRRRVEKKGFKTRCENDENFNKFIAEISSISFLPIADVEEGLEHVDKKHKFDDEKAQKFKREFVDYVREFWINGPIPVRIWNVFGRSDDITNNAQEGYNSKFNKELNVTHPSPGVLLCHLRSQIVLAEDKLVRILGGLKKPAQRKAYKELAKRRLRLKKQYLEGKELGDEKAMDRFLSNMGHNVKSATMSGRVTDYEETTSQDTYGENENPDISTWIPRDENSILEDMENEDVYEHRNVGERKKADWRKKKCVSCKLGFNARSNPVKCDGCDQYTHKKVACLKETHRNSSSQFLCRLCVPNHEQSEPEQPQGQDADISKVDNGFKCNVCSLTVKTKYSIRRHMLRMHGDQTPDVVENVIETENVRENRKPKKNLVDVLKNINLMQYSELFLKENIDLEMLKSLNDDEFMNMFRDIGISTWGHRHQLKKAVQNTLDESHENISIIDDEVECGEVEVDESNKDDLACSETDEEADPIDCAVCASTTQHFCVLCEKKVCVIFCSVQDPNSTNEYTRKHRENDPRCSNNKFTCPICEKKFAKENELKFHMKNHTETKKFTCPVCHEEFAKKNDFDNHMNNHNETSYEEISLISSTETEDSL